MINYLGDIKVEIVNKEFYRLTVNMPFPFSLIDQMEAEGETLAEALLALHEQVEAVRRV